jgi:hypothetical protein
MKKYEKIQIVITFLGRRPTGELSHKGNVLFDRVSLRAFCLTAKYLLTPFRAFRG